MQVRYFSEQKGILIFILMIIIIIGIVSPSRHTHYIIRKYDIIRYGGTQIIVLDPDFYLACTNPYPFDLTRNGFIYLSEGGGVTSRGTSRNYMH